jgi:uncharacterized protein DUF2510
MEAGMAGVGTPRRLSYGAVAAGIGGIVLIISLFLDWASAGGFSQTGWESFSVTDIALFVLGLLAIGYAALEFTGAAIRLPVERNRALTVVGIIATTITLVFLVEGSNQAIGLILAVLASLAILAGGYLAERRPELALTVGGGSAQAEAWRPPTAASGAEAPTQPQQPVSYGQPSAAPPPVAAPPPAAPTPAPPQPVEPPPPPGGTADWYPDPRGLKRLRYWDGTRWTEHVAD